MASVLSYLRELNIVTMMLRILLAVLCGGLIGLERERKNRPAGFRTYMLTALGATLTVLLSLQLDQMLHGPWRALAESIGATQDVSRFGAEAAKGIGFLGAGTIIITARQQVKGLTTAAGLWASACLGLAIGAGFYACAFISMLFMIVCMYALPPLERRMTRRAHHMNISLEIESMEKLGTVVGHLRAQGVRIFDFEVNRSGSAALPNFPEHYGSDGGVVSAVPLCHGIGILTGLEAVTVPTATGEGDTDYAAKVAAALGVLKKHDFVALHLEGPDEATHNHDLEHKIYSIERLSADVVAPVTEALRAAGEDFRLLLLSDHMTYMANGAHGADPVPFVLYDSRVSEGSGLPYSEANGRKGPYVDDGAELMDLLFELKKL